jgi:hypothetical protein
VIETGATFEQTLQVGVGTYGSNYYPQFDRPELSGTFRLVWSDALSSFQDRLPFGEPIGLEHRVSNSFHLVVD